MHSRTNSWVPELLCPAGSLEKLKVATLYGADAVYLGGQQFGLRSAAENFTSVELAEGVAFAHAHGTKVFVVLNGFLHDQDFVGLIPFVQELEQLKVDAVIVSDLGVIQTVREHSSLPIHLSTQASCLNVAAARLWKKMGVERIVLGREVSIQEAKKIKQQVDIEVEMFIHGSMCMAYSGNCVISNYTQGRDSNRGGCAHSCRFEYELDFSSSSSDNVEQMQKRQAFFMSSKDLSGIRLLQDFIEAGIDSLKVEGRMKAHHYAGTVSKVYGEALDFYRQNGHFLSDQLSNWEQELKKVSHRDYTEASLQEQADHDSVYFDREGVQQDYNVVGVVLESLEQRAHIVEVRSPFKLGDQLEIVPFKGPCISVEKADFKSVNGEYIERTRPGSLIRIPYIEGVSSWNLIRSRIEERV